MNNAFPRKLCFFLIAGIVMCPGLTAFAQVNSNATIRPAIEDQASAPQIPEIKTGDFRSLVLPLFRYDIFPAPIINPNDAVGLLQNAITKRLGIRYRYFGTDDRGYDCSGFVWSVFKDIGADFERGAARMLWRELPEAMGEETMQFGTLVFFNGLKHIGIVRDAHSFYHASRSHGVTLSYFSGYWERRITGYRRAPEPILPAPPELIRSGD